MNANVTGLLNTKAVAYGAAIVVGGALLYWVANKVIDKAAGAAEAVGNAVNPTSDQNLAYRGVNGAGAALSGDPAWSLGSWLYDRFNPPYDPNAGQKYEPRKLEVRAESSIFSWLTKNG